MIALLNSLFPPLPRWHTVLLVVAFCLSAANCTVNTLRGESFAASLTPLLLLFIVWRPLPKRRLHRVAFWVMTCCLTYVLSFTLYYTLLGALR